MMIELAPRNDRANVPGILRFTLQNFYTYTLEESS